MVSRGYHKPPPAPRLEKAGEFYSPMIDHFHTFGIDRTFGIDAAKLEKRFHELQSESHPDRHVTAGSDERERALAESAATAKRIYDTWRTAWKSRKKIQEVDGRAVSAREAVP